MTLLAKAIIRNRPDKTLLEHTRDVVDAAEQLFGNAATPTRLGERWLRFFKVPEDWSRFYETLLAACLFHDWGKANADMQGILYRTGSGQLFRHEHLSVLLLGGEGVAQWTAQKPDIDWDVLLAAVGSHHLKFCHETFAPDSNGRVVRMHLDHPDFDAIVGETGTRLGLEGRPTFPDRLHWGFTGDAATLDLTELSKTLRERLHRLKTTPMLSAVRAALIAADAVGSGLPRTGHTIAEWVAEQFGREFCDTTKVGNIIDQRIAELTRRNSWNNWNQFQNDAATLPGRALLLAPCGSGKTLAAWRWIQSQVAPRPVKRVLFLYPTRATATEGFKDYVSWAPEDDAALLHGTSGYDLDGMFPAEDPRGGSTYDASDPRLFALQYWSKSVFSATVDQFFAFLSYGYGPTCLLPLLADSVIVVDEVHSFDKAMFSALLKFLESFDVPVLCMTATLEAGRKRKLAKRVEAVYGYDEQPADLAELAGTPRYLVNEVESGDAARIVRAAVADGKRVLWVVNQVSRAQAAFASLEDLQVPKACYHSRFRLGDRRERHRETVQLIRAGEPPAVVVSTQVCEMSLDIDADVLLTELCPISSLIQRMGRCRRGRGELAAKGAGEVYVYQPDEERVYSPDNLKGVGEFLAFLQSKSAVSQTDLEAGLELHGAKGVEAAKLVPFLTSGAYARAGEDSFRDIEAFNVQAVLDGDLGAYLAATPEARPGFVVPVPRKVKPIQDSRLPHWLRVAPAANYDETTGFHDEPHTGS